MKLLEAFRIAMRALAANKLRSILTMLGIIIGVGAVIALMSIGRGVEKYVTEQFAGLGSNLLFIAPGGFDDGPTNTFPEPFTLRDMEALSDPAYLPDIAGVATEYSSGARLERGDRSTQLQVRGVTPSYFDVLNWQLDIGGLLTQRDFDERSRVVVLGADAYRNLFDANEYPLEQSVRINNLSFRVVGLVQERGGGLAGNQDNTAFIPLSTAQERLFRRKTIHGDYIVDVIYASVANSDRMGEAQTQIEEVLRERRGISYLDDDDFSIISQTDIISVFGQILGALTIFLGAIAGISLLVGGIGIMNIMLVSVTERTREIGLRKAVGATRSDVLIQFLVEAVTLAVIGGVLGILLGVAGAQGISQISDAFSAVVGADAVLLALAFSSAVGLFFGIYPAYRASRLNPIDALRYE